MVNAARGILITCDPAIKQFILYLDKEEFHFSIIDLDDTHLFLHSTDESVITRIQQKIDELQEENTFVSNLCV